MTAITSPSHWTTTRLDEIAEVRLGRQRSPERATGPNMVLYLRAANITWRGIDLSDVKEMDFNAAEVETYRLKDGDILLAEASGSPSEVGKPAIYRKLDTLHCFQNTLIRIRSRPDIGPFLHLHFVKDAALGAFARASRGVGIHHLGAEALSTWSICFPPLREQVLIVDAVDSYLSRLDAAVAILERVDAKLKAYRATVLKAAVEGRLVTTEAELALKEKRIYEPADALLVRILKERRRRWEEAELAKLRASGKAPKGDTWKAKYEEPVPPDATKLPPLPEGWCWTTLGALLAEPLRNGHSARETEGQEGIRTFTLTAVTQSDFGAHNTKLTVADAEKVDDLWLMPGDILVERANAPELVGLAAMYRGREAYAIFPDLLIRVRVTPYVDGEYVLASLISPASRRHFQSRAQGIAGSMPKISQGTVESLAVALPPAPEGARLITEMQRLLSVVAVVDSEVRSNALRIRRLRQSVLNWAFEGKLVDQDPADESAEDLLVRIRAERAATAPTKNTGGRKVRATA